MYDMTIGHTGVEIKPMRVVAALEAYAKILNDSSLDVTLATMYSLKLSLMCHKGHNGGNFGALVDMLADIL